MQHIDTIIDSIVAYLGPAIDRNFARWSLLGTYVWPNYYVFDTYEEEIDYLKSWTLDRLVWMDQEILSLTKGEPIPQKYFLYPAYPNPFNPAVSIRYDLPEEGPVRIVIHDLAGRFVRTLLNERQNFGSHTMIWNTVDHHHGPIPGGVYLLSIESGNFRKTQKIMLLK